jgi:hypothetical protein
LSFILQFPYAETVPSIAPAILPMVASTVAVTAFIRGAGEV